MKRANFKQKRRSSTVLKTVLFLAFIFSFTLQTSAQVTIGAGEQPVSGALLQLKNKENVTDGTFNASKGLALPRVTLSEKKELYPMFLQNPEDPASGPNADYAANKSTLDKSHTGLIVYNLVEDDDKELCLGLNQWDGEQWNCFESKMGNAVATLGNCDSLKFIGQYQNNVSLNAGNYMTIPLHVTKAGAYTITAIPDPDNGYYFTASGVFLTTGYYFLSVPGAGTPINYTQAGNPGDLIKITFNGKAIDTCDPKYVKVEDSSIKPLYVMDCSKTKVRGVYKIDVPLNPATNFIEMTLNVDLSAVGATYIIETNTVDGIYFKDEGLLTGTVMNITLKGYGIPNSLDDKHFTITSNSQKTTATCKATVIVVIPKKRLLSIGTSENDFGYNFSGSAASNVLITTKANYGDLETSVVKFEGWTEIRNGTNSPSATQLTEWLLGANPYDIVVVGYSWTMSESEADVFTKYLAKGGVLLLYCESNAGVGRLFRNLFADSNIGTGSVNAAGALYNLPYTDDIILNGPFGDIRGLVWGEDASSTTYATNLPASQIDIYSDGTNQSTASPSGTAGRVTAFKHKTLNLIWIGDGGFNSNHSGSSDTICPFKLDSNGYPIYKTGYGNGTSAYEQNVYNAVFTANAFAWAINQAQFNGINTP